MRKERGRVPGGARAEGGRGGREGAGGMGVGGDGAARRGLESVTLLQCPRAAAPKGLIENKETRAAAPLPGAPSAVLCLPLLGSLRNPPVTQGGPSPSYRRVRSLAGHPQEWRSLGGPSGGTQWKQ